MGSHAPPILELSFSVLLKCSFKKIQLFDSYLRVFFFFIDSVKCIH